VDSAMYSIDKLFTEKELSMHYNNAALAATHYFNRRVAAAALSAAGGAPADSPPSVAPSDIADDTADGLATATPPEMDRSANLSATHHATRSTRNTAAAALAAAGPNDLAACYLPALPIYGPGFYASASKDKSGAVTAKEC